MARAIRPSARNSEVDRGAWFTVDEARVRIFKGQETLLDRLTAKRVSG